MLVCVVDYGLGNVRSVYNALRLLGYRAEVTSDPARLTRAEILVLPGVGAFDDAMAHLRRRGLLPVIEAAREAGKAVLGICLGMQILYEGSEEGGRERGLGFLPGRVRRLPGTVKVPHMGWNLVEPTGPSPLFPAGEPCYLYFAHSYHAPEEGEVLARVTYGLTFPAAVRRGSIFGVQFHPEKSGRAGLAVLGRLLAYAREVAA